MWEPMFVPLLGNDFGNPSVIQALGEYNAETEVIVLFFLGEPEPIMERFSDETLPPPQAYEKHKESANR